MVFCNELSSYKRMMYGESHNPYFNRWFSAIIYYCPIDIKEFIVTILILIDGFLQYRKEEIYSSKVIGHNPYFNRWFSAISFLTMILFYNISHNPYFNRWFSAICSMYYTKRNIQKSQSLF